MTVRDIVEAMTASGYVTDSASVAEALQSRPDAFSPVATDEERWSAIGARFPGFLPPRPARLDAASYRDESRKKEIVDYINALRRARKERALDEAQIAELLENLPGGRTSPCWRCPAWVSDDTNLACDSCGWLICWCGACRQPIHGDCPRWNSVVGR